MRWPINVGPDEYNTFVGKAVADATRLGLNPDVEDAPSQHLRRIWWEVIATPPADSPWERIAAEARLQTQGARLTVADRENFKIAMLAAIQVYVQSRARKPKQSAGGRFAEVEDGGVSDDEHHPLVLAAGAMRGNGSRPRRDDASPRSNSNGFPGTRRCARCPPTGVGPDGAAVWATHPFGQRCTVSRSQLHSLLL